MEKYDPGMADLYAGRGVSMVGDIGIDLGGDSGPRLGIERMVFRLVVTSGRSTSNLFLENGFKSLVADAPTTLANGAYLLNGHGDPPGNH